jgi:hypothetical protein
MIGLEERKIKVRKISKGIPVVMLTKPYGI